MSLAICLFCFIPLFIFLTEKNENYRIPILLVWAGITAIQYGFRSLIYGNFIQYGHNFIEEEVFRSSQWLILLSITCCFTAYFLIRKSEIVQNAQRHYLSFNMSANLKLIFIVGVTGNLAYAFETVAGGIFYTFNQFFPAAIQQPIKLIAGLPIIAIIILFTGFLRGELTKKQNITFWLCIFTPRLILGGLTGISFQIIGVLIPLVFIYLTIKKKIPFGIIATFIILFSIFQGIRNSNLRKNRNYISADRYKLDSSSYNLQNNMETYTKLIDRLGAHNMLGLAVANIPEKHDYFKSKALGTAVFALIPRLIWKDKPSPVDLREFGYRVGVFGANWPNMSNNVRPTQLGMLYATWGIPALIIGMLFFGALYGIIENYTQVLSNSFEYGKVLLGTVCATSLIDIEGDCFAVLARTIWPALMVFVLCMAFQWNERRGIEPTNGEVGG